MPIFMTYYDNIAPPCVLRLSRHATGIAIPGRVLSLKNLFKLTTHPRRWPTKETLSGDMCKRNKLDKNIEAKTFGLYLGIFLEMKKGCL